MYMPEQCYCCVLQMLAKTGLFLAVNLQFCRLCHAPALRLTLSLQPWLCGAGITACSHVDQNATWYSACLQPCETSMVCPNFCPELCCWLAMLCYCTWLASLCEKAHCVIACAQLAAVNVCRVSILLYVQQGHLGQIWGKHSVGLRECERRDRSGDSTCGSLHSSWLAHPACPGSMSTNAGCCCKWWPAGVLQAYCCGCAQQLNCEQ